MPIEDRVEPQCYERVTCRRQPQFKAGVCCARQSGPSLELVGNVVQEIADDEERLKKERGKHSKLEQEDGQIRKRVFRCADALLPQALFYVHEALISGGKSSFCHVCLSSNEHKAKLKAAWDRRPRRFTDEHKAKMVAAWKNRPREFSDATREKMRLAALGRQHSIRRFFLCWVHILCAGTCLKQIHCVAQESRLHARKL